MRVLCKATLLRLWACGIKRRTARTKFYSNVSVCFHIYVPQTNRETWRWVPRWSEDRDHRIKGSSDTSKSSAEACVAGTTATDVLWSSLACGMQPVKEAGYGDPQPCNPIPPWHRHISCGPSPPAWAQWGCWVLQKHSNQTRIASDRNAWASTPGNAR